MDAVRLKSELWEHFRLVGHVMSTVFLPVMEKYGLTMAGGRVLSELDASGETTVGNISQILGSSSGNTSTLCKRLEKMGYIVRLRSEDDERVVILSLTPEGQKVISEVNCQLQTICDPVIQDIAKGDMDQIFHGMHKMEDFLKQFQETSEEKSVV